MSTHTPMQRALLEQQGSNAASDTVQAHATEDLHGEQSKRCVPYWMSPGLKLAFESVEQWLCDVSVGLTLISGPDKVGKSRFLQVLVDRMTAKPVEINGALIRFIPLYIEPEDLQDIASTAALARKVDVLIHQNLLHSAYVKAQHDGPNTTCSDKKIGSSTPDSIPERHWFFLVVDNATQLGDETLRLLVIHGLMLRPQACLTLLADGPILLTKVRGFISQLQYLRRQLHILDVPPFTRGESERFMRHVSDYLNLPAQWSEQQLQAAHGESMGAPGELTDIVVRYAKSLPVSETPQVRSHKQDPSIKKRPQVIAGSAGSSSVWGRRCVALLMLLALGLLIWLLLGQMGAVARVDTPDFLKDAPRITASLFAVGQAEKAVKRQKSIFSWQFSPWVLWQRNFRFSMSYPLSHGGIIFTPNADNKPPVRQAPITGAPITVPTRKSAFANSASSQEVLLPKPSNRQPYDVRSAIEILFAWPASHFVVQMDADHDISRLRRRWQKHDNKIGGAPLILPMSHRGRAGWVAVVGPFESAEVSTQFAQGYWARRVADLQQAVLRLSAANTLEISQND